MAFTPAFLDELRGRLSLASVIGRRVKLTRRGREYSGLCPFHNEKSPSFTVNEDKGFFHCFGCGAHGDVIGFEMRIANLPFPEAVEKLAQELGLEVPVSTPEERVRAVRESGLHEVMESACVWFERQLRGPRGAEALDYLRRRGLDDETLARFRLGFAPDSRDGLKTALMSDERPESLLVEAGLLKKPEEGGTRDLFRGRVMFPITDRRGRVIAFGGRILGDGQPKYLNSPDTPLFHKGRVLYGLALARSRARDLGKVVVSEGYMDVIALHRAGFDYAVAPLGTAMTEAQLEEVWKLSDEPILSFDGDGAGIRAAQRAADRALPLLKPGKSLRIALIPPPEDPDSLIRKSGAGAMQAVLDRAEPLHELIWRGLIEGRPLDTPERRAALEADMLEKVRGIEDRGVASAYERMFRDKLRDLMWQASRAARAPAVKSAGAPNGGWRRDFRGGAGGGNRWSEVPRTRLNLPPLTASSLLQTSESSDGFAVEDDLNDLRERILLATVLNHPALGESVAEALGSITFGDKALDNLRRETLKHLVANPGQDSGELHHTLGSRGFSEALDLLLSSSVYAHAAFAKPSAEFEKARTGWEHAFRLYTHRDLQRDVDRAEAALAERTSLESFNHVVTLARQAARDKASGDADG